MQVISRTEAIEILKTIEIAIVKITKGSGCGDGVRKITNKSTIEQLEKDFGNDFIVQEIIKQSSYTALFNEPSLNTFRISTLNINGVCSLCSIAYRCGQGNTYKDNTGAGGIMVGVSEEGQFNKYGYDNTYHKYYTSSNGVDFSKGHIPNMKQIVEYVLWCHRTYLPNLGHCGWDIALDSDNNPVMIEVNLVYPGIQYEQLCNALPHFGERTNEVIEFVRKHGPNFTLSEALN